MGEPSCKDEFVLPAPPRINNRKRILESAEEQHEEKNSVRRQNLFSEWQETLRGIGVPNKKGYSGNDNHYNDIIDQGLADNFEDSLTGLGVDITTASYNMSDAMLALPNVGLLKTESDHGQILKIAPPSEFDEGSQGNTTDRFFKLLATDNYTEPTAPYIQQMFQQHITFSDKLLNEGTTSAEFAETPTPDVQSEESLSLSSPVDDYNDCRANCLSPYENNRFQYVLCASTSAAVKLKDETLAYLNQNQPYELKAKKLGDSNAFHGRLIRTKLRITFHERRMRFVEKEQIALWKSMRPGERIIEIDVPLSYGISNVKQESKHLNTCQFDWDPNKEVGVFIKVNCISTEFTPRKHGGEKGVPFSFIIETFSQGQSCAESLEYERVHASSCQIKVFKLKGADRKHKQEKDKLAKLSTTDLDKYQDQCESTVLQDINFSRLEEETPPRNSSPIPISRKITPTSINNTHTISPAANSSTRESPVGLLSYSPACSNHSNEAQTKILQVVNTSSCQVLDSDALASDTEIFLISNRFSNLVPIFSNFTGMDLLRLSKSEIIEICGLVDGIRLFNTLHPKTVTPLLTIYLRLESQLPYNALYLYSLTLSEFTKRVAAFMNVASSSIYDIFIQGPNNIDVLVSDEVVRNLIDQTVYSVEILQNYSAEKFRIFLKQSPNDPQTP